MSDNADEVKDRVAERFQTTQDEDHDTTDHDRDHSGATAESDQHVQTDTGSRNTMTEQNARDDQNAKKVRNAQNVKKAWNAITVYLPDDIERKYSKAYKRLDLELTDDDITLKKTRHYNPLVIELGMEQLERMERNEITERIEQFEP